MIRVGMAAIALAALAAPAAAQQAAPEKEKKVCKSVREIGSRIASERVCRTRAEWDQIARETRKELQDYGRTASQGSQGTGN